jgi:hypothetical protein
LRDCGTTCVPVWTGLCCALYGLASLSVGLLSVCAGVRQRLAGRLGGGRILRVRNIGRAAGLFEQDYAPGSDMCLSFRPLLRYAVGRMKAGT